MSKVIRPFATLVSVEGWRNGDHGWNWNNQHKLAEYSREAIADVLCGDRDHKDSNRARSSRIFRFLRAEGYLSDHSKGRVRLDVSGSDPDYFTIEDKNTGEPIFALIVEWDAEPETPDAIPFKGDEDQRADA